VMPNDQHHRAAARDKVARTRVDRRSGACAG